MYPSLLRILTLALATLLPFSADARVVINEIFYNAPDDIDDLEFVELHNSGDDPVDLSSWRFSKGLKFTFPAGTRIEAGGFLVVCRNPERFREFYDAPVAGTFDSKLSNNGERIELSDARGRVVDTVKYQDTAPWPLGADGESGSLERICPDSAGDNFVNWAASPLSADRTRPTGTPGNTNANFSAELPPIISKVRSAPERPIAGRPLTIEAAVRDAEGVAEVKLLYRIAGSGYEKDEIALPMKATAEGLYSAEIPGQEAGQLIRYRIQASGTGGARRTSPAESEPRPAFSAYVPATIDPAKIPFGWIVQTSQTEVDQARERLQRRAREGGFGPGFFRRPDGRGDADSSAKKQPASHRSAFIYSDPATGHLEVFDFVQVEPRKGGFKVHFGKGQLFHEMTAINLIFEHNEKFVLAEPLAYEVYRKAGIAAALSYHVRLWLDGQPLGYHLLVEQPNRGFLRRNGLDDGGNLYKILWYERGLVGQHEKKTNTREGHADLLALIDALNSTKGEAQWEVIRKQFDVEQVVNYFAVNTVLSHWDGFFNNYFTYHDLEGTGRWTLYPWDQDQTWGITAMMGADDVFYTMPITFGMEGDIPPGDGSAPAGNTPFRRGGPRGRDAMWWRPGGYFSKPLLANPAFRKLYLARTREITETIYTEANFHPLIEAMGERLAPEVRLRAELLKQDPERAAQNLQRNLQNMKDHLRQRREFLLAQEEIKIAGKFSIEGLEKPVSRKAASKSSPTKSTQ